MRKAKKKNNAKMHPRGISLQEWEREVFARRPDVKREYDALDVKLKP